MGPSGTRKFFYDHSVIAFRHEADQPFRLVCRSILPNLEQIAVKRCVAPTGAHRDTSCFLWPNPVLVPALMRSQDVNWVCIDGLRMRRCIPMLGTKRLFPFESHALSMGAELADKGKLGARDLCCLLLKLQPAQSSSPLA